MVSLDSPSALNPHPCLPPTREKGLKRSMDMKVIENVLAQHIEATPGVLGGKPRIAGHRIRVMDIVVWHEKRAIRRMRS
jgi:hypothetical protein